MGAVRFPRQRLTHILYRNFPTASLGLQTYTSFSPVNTLFGGAYQHFFIVKLMRLYDFTDKLRFVVDTTCVSGVVTFVT